MKLRWMPLDVADYRADTMHLGAFEHGVYLLMIMHYWQAGGLPDDEEQLARICCCTKAEFRRVRPVMEAFFKPGWKHKRIEKELDRARKVNTSASEKARDAAHARWSKRGALRETSVAPNGAPGIASDNAASTVQAMPGDAPSQVPLPSPTQIIFKNPSGEGKRDVNWPPRHGLVSQRTGRIYVVKGTPEWDAYADDYRQARGEEPNINPHGGRWFKTLGEGS